MLPKVLPVSAHSALPSSSLAVLRRGLAATGRTFTSKWNPQEPPEPCESRSQPPNPSHSSRCAQRSRGESGLSKSASSCLRLWICTVKVDKESGEQSRVAGGWRLISIASKLDCHDCLISVECTIFTIPIVACLDFGFELPVTYRETSHFDSVYLPPTCSYKRENQSRSGYSLLLSKIRASCFRPPYPSLWSSGATLTPSFLCDMHMYSPPAASRAAGRLVLHLPKYQEPARPQSVSSKFRIKQIDDQ